METKQSAIALSTAEAEQRHLLRDLGYCKWKQPQFIRRVKFASKLQIMIWFRLENCQVKLIYCRTELILADAVTKALCESHVCKICNINYNSRHTARSEQKC